MNLIIILQLELQPTACVNYLICHGDAIRQQGTRKHASDIKLILQLTN